ncbi:MAG: UGSC family (seleno)protein [Geodermatophilaceae bacterium]
MNRHLTVLDPTEAGATSRSTELVDLPKDLAGVRFGVLDNGKPNSDRFLTMVAERFLARGALLYGTRRKPSIGRLAPPDMLEQLIGACDLVVTGVGDCAGCCSCSVQDGIAVERAGVPTVVIVTTEFLTTARISARAAGIPDYPFVVIDHPLGSLTPPLLGQRADMALDQISTRLAGAR